jgi:hypothetical protein
LPVLARVKKLALAFRTEGELAEQEGKTNEAARVYLDGIRFGQEVCRGGLLIDRLVGIACEAITLAPWNTLVWDLDATTCRELAHGLELQEATREPIGHFCSVDRSNGLADVTALAAARHDLLPARYAFDAIQTTRGCPLNCSVCSVTAFNGAQYRQRPIPDVIREFQSIGEKRVPVVDDNLIDTRLLRCWGTL